MRPGDISSSVAALLIASCAGGAPDARYPSREPGCAVKQFAGTPAHEVEDLGTVAVDCEAGRSCDRQLLDAVCARGGDVAWGLGDNALNASHRVAHAAHTKRAGGTARESGCAVQVLDEAPRMPTDNIGPVSAVCAEDDSKEVCLRELEDQVCRLGGDVLWQVEGPSPEGNKQHMSGRAAHTK
jgi:hypothetical protein